MLRGEAEKLKQRAGWQLDRGRKVGRQPKDNEGARPADNRSHLPAGGCRQAVQVGMGRIRRVGVHSGDGGRGGLPPSFPALVNCLVPIEV